MSKSFVEIILGDLEEKREYRRFMKRVNALPKDYHFAFKKIQNYMYNVGTGDCGMTIFIDLIDLFEENAAKRAPVLQVIGNDVSKFCDDLILASSSTGKTVREKLNKEIMEHFQKERKICREEENIHA